MQWHQLDHMQTIRTSFQSDNYTNTLALFFYMLDALPDDQPTVPKHQWQRKLYRYLSVPCDNSKYCRVVIMCRRT